MDGEEEEDDTLLLRFSRDMAGSMGLKLVCCFADEDEDNEDEDLDDKT